MSRPIALLCLIFMLLTGTPAQAHTDLTSSSPETGQRLGALPDHIRLEFSDAVDPALASVALTAEGVEPVVLDARTGDRPTVLEATVPAATDVPGPGDMRIVYRVTSVDGHPIQGWVDFAVTTDPPPPGGSSSPGPDASERVELDGSADAPAPNGTSAEDEAVSPWRTLGSVVSALLVLVLAALGVGTSRWVRNHRTRGDRGELSP